MTVLATLDGSGIESDLWWRDVDDGLHAVGDPALDWTETMWWSFNVPERALAGWLYTQIRPNLGTCAGGAFVYDPSAHLPWQLPWYAYQHHQPLPDPLDLRDVALRTGVSSRLVEPGMIYDLAYQFRDQEDFLAELRFEGLTPPVPHLQGAPPFTGSSHYDQHGRLRGKLSLGGEEIDVDCISVRDRSWGRRPERIGRGQRLSYAFGHNDAGELFLAFAVPPADDPLGDEESFASGYLVRDGQLRRWEHGTRRTVRDPETGGVAEIFLEGVDTERRGFRAEGRARSRMMLPNVGITINTLLEWQTEAGRGFGEDQDVWSNAHMRDVHQRTMSG
jgi:hypothetical protein